MNGGSRLRLPLDCVAERVAYWPAAAPPALYPLQGIIQLDRQRAIEHRVCAVKIAVGDERPRLRHERLRA